MVAGDQSPKSTVLIWISPSSRLNHKYPTIHGEEGAALGHFLLPCTCLKSDLNLIYHKRKVLLIELKNLDEGKGRIFKGGLSGDCSLP
jgi:hypothetical protein